METRPTLETVLSHCLFFVDRRSRLSRDEIRQWLVELALFQADKALTPQEITRAVFALLAPSDENPFALNSLETERVIAKLLASGRIQKSKRAEEVLLMLTDKRKSEISAAKARFCVTREGFAQQILKAAKDAVVNADFSPEQEIAIVQAAEYAVEQVFQRNVIQLALLTDTITRMTPASDPRISTASDVLPTRLSAIFGPLDVRIPKIQHAIVDVLKSGDPAVQQYLTLCHHSLLYMHLLGLDPSLQNYHRNLLKQRRMFLDTNVIVALMFRFHRRHRIVHDLVADAQRLKMTLAVFPWTVDEIQRYLKGVRTQLEHFPEISKDPQEMARLSHILAEIAASGRRLDNLNLNTFFAAFDPRPWLKEHHIQIIELEIPDGDTEREVLSDLTSIIYNCKIEQGRQTSWTANLSAAAEHDACCLWAANMLRCEEREDTMGPRTWFLTLDSSLAPAETRIVLHRNLYRLPCSLRVNAFVEELVAYESPAIPADRYSDYTSLLVESQLALVDFDEGVSVERMLATVDSPAIPECLSIEAGVDATERQTTALAIDQILKTTSETKDVNAKTEILTPVLKEVAMLLRREQEAHRRAHESESFESRLERLEKDFAEKLLVASQREQGMAQQVRELQSSRSELEETCRTLEAKNKSLRTKLGLCIAALALGALATFLRLVVQHLTR